MGEKGGRVCRVRRSYVGQCSSQLLLYCLLLAASQVGLQFIASRSPIYLRLRLEYNPSYTLTGLASACLLISLELQAYSLARVTSVLIS